MKKLLVQQNQAFRSVESDWLSQNQRALRQYAGEWIVLEGQEIVAHDTRYVTARRAALHLGITTPFIFLVSSETDETFMGI